MTALPRLLLCPTARLLSLTVTRRAILVAAASRIRVNYAGAGGCQSLPLFGQIAMQALNPTPYPGSFRRLLLRACDVSQSFPQAAFGSINRPGEIAQELL